MSTKFFMSDERYMSRAEIADAEAFDESALICHSQNGTVFTLEIPTISFYNLPRAARVTNDNNNLKIHTVGGLIDATRETTAQIITQHQAEQTAEACLARLRDERKWQTEWRGVLPDRLPPSRSKVAEYARRISAKSA